MSMDELPGYCAACFAKITDITCGELYCPKCGVEITEAEQLLSEEQMAQMKVNADHEWQQAKKDGLIS